MKNLSRSLIALVLVFSFLSTSIYASNISTSPESYNTNFLMEFVKNFTERRTQSITVSINEVTPLVLELSNGISRSIEEQELIKESNVVFSNEERVVSNLSDFRDVLLQRGEAYTHFDKELTLVSYEVSSNTISMIVREFTKLYYARTHGDEPEYTAWSVERNFVFEKDAQGWTLISQDIIGDIGVPPMNEPNGAAKD